MPPSWLQMTGGWSVEWHYPLTAQPVVGLCRLAFQPKAQTASGPGIGCGDAPAFAPLRQPKLLVRVVAAAESDLARAVVGQRPLDHLHGEERAERQIVEPPVMRELVNDGAAIPQGPNLRRGGHPIDVV